MGGSTGAFFATRETTFVSTCSWVSSLCVELILSVSSMTPSV